MGPSDPAERARQAEAVSVVRTGVPAYAFLSLLLFGPPILRAIGIATPSGTLQSLWSGGLLLALIVSAAVIINRLAGLGQYRVGAGLRFDFGAALFRGEYVPVGGSLPATPAVSTPLPVLRADVSEVLPTLVARGDLLLAETLTAALNEAESVARLIEIHDVNPGSRPLPAARTAIGAYTDHVLGLRNELQRGELVAAASLARVQEDLRALRAATDALRNEPQTAVESA